MNIPYTESRKVSSCRDRKSSIEDFLAWMTERGLSVVNEQGQDAFSGRTHESIAFEVLGIDEKKLEEERIQMQNDLLE